MTYRPWGSLGWLLNHLSVESWHFLGCIGTEFRSLACWRHAAGINKVQQQKMLIVHDLYSNKYGDEVNELLATRREEFESAGMGHAGIVEMPLFQRLDKIQAIGYTMCKKCTGNVIFDITSLPKRFWFPILKVFLIDSHIKNLVVTYTRAASYAKDGEPLFEDINRGMDEPLPGFGGQNSEAPMWVASAGFMIDSLKSFAESNTSDPLRVLFPFPASLENIRREWLSIAKLQDELQPGRFDLYRVDPRNVSFCFDQLVSFKKTSGKPLAFAPFGPKPISLAMCIYASLDQTVSVHYPQPSVYNPSYSSGIYQDDPVKAIDAYLIKCGGDCLYSIQS